MFGKPEWFQPKTFGWGLHPVTWQGWAYTGAWLTGLVVPFVALVSWHPQPPVEALLWLTVGGAALVYDVRQILRALRNPPGAGGTVAASGPSPAGGPDREVFYIGDSNPGATVHTRKFCLRNG